MTEDVREDLVPVLRSMAQDTVWMKTHYEGCWRWHPYCAMLVAADLIDALKEEIEDRSPASWEI